MFKPISVSPGDFGTTYRLLNGVHGASNRTIEMHKVKEYGAHLDQICAGLPVTLLFYRDQYHILDGQHRIKAMSDFSSHPREILALVVTIEDVERLWGSLIECVRKLNNNKPMGLLGKLELYKRVSPWVIAFGDDAEEYFAFTRAKAKVKWTTLLRAVSTYQRSLKNKTLLLPMAMKEEDVVQWFINPDKALVSETVKAMRPWLRVNAEAYRVKKITQLSSEVPMLVWLLASKLYANKPHLNGYPEKLLECPNLQSLPYWDRSIGFCGDLINKGFNYRRPAKHCISIFGIGGRAAE